MRCFILQFLTGHKIHNICKIIAKQDIKINVKAQIHKLS